jgi:tRNA A37 threonylcarbamoyladenosine dehydratase
MIMLCMRMATAYHRRITIPEVVAGMGGGRKTQPVLFQVAAINPGLVTLTYLDLDH